MNKERGERYISGDTGMHREHVLSLDRLRIKGIFTQLLRNLSPVILLRVVVERGRRRELG